MAATKKNTGKSKEPRLPGFFFDDDGAGIRPIPSPSKAPAKGGKKPAGSKKK